MELSIQNIKSDSYKNFTRDLVAGMTVGVIAIPLAMAFAIASGAKPESGIYTTIIAGILISALGGSRYQIGGPTGAFIPILFAIVQQYGFEKLLIAGMISGFILIMMGLLKMGTLIKYIPRPVTIGFTSGIAVIIFWGQVPDFLGLNGFVKHQDFLSNFIEIFSKIATINIYSVLTACICLGIILITPKAFPKVPGALIGLVTSSIVANLFYAQEVATIGSVFGNIPSSLPSFHFPHLTFDNLLTLTKPAFIIAMLGGIESLLSATVADGMTGEKHNSNKELIGQGLANVITPLFGGIPATGAIARTATNIKSGAVTSLSGVIHGLVVMIVLLLFAPYASNIPLASMSPILMVVAWNMSQRKVFSAVLRTKSGDSLVLIITFVLTVLIDLTTAVEVGLILAAVLFVKRMSDILNVAKVLPDHNDKGEKVGQHMVYDGHDCPQISIFSIEGPLFFGAAQVFESSIMNTIKYRPKIMILRMGKVPYMDTTGLANLTSIIDHFQSHKGIIILSGVQPQPMEVLRKTGVDQKLGHAGFFHHTGEALNQALALLDYNKCLGCTHNAFRECMKLSTKTENNNKIKEIALPMSKI